MIPGLQESCLEVEWDREESDDDISKGKVGDEIICHRLKQEIIAIIIIKFDVRGVHFILMPVCGSQRVSHVFDSQTQVWLLPTKVISTSAPSENRTQNLE